MSVSLFNLYQIMSSSINERIDLLTFGDPDFKSELLGLLRKELPIQYNEVLEAHANADYESIRFWSHKFKGSIAGFAEETDFDIIQKFEQLLKANHIKEALEIAPEAIIAMSKYVTLIENLD